MKDNRQRQGKSGEESNWRKKRQGKKGFGGGNRGGEGEGDKTKVKCLKQFKALINNDVKNTLVVVSQ